MIIIIGFILIRKVGYNGIKQVAEVKSVGRRNHIGFSNAQVIEFIGFQFLGRRIGFINSKDDRFLGHTDQFGHFLVFCRNPCTGVTDKEDDIGFLDGNLSLLPDGNGNGVGIGNFNPARIDHHEAAV